MGTDAVSQQLGDSASMQDEGWRERELATSYLRARPRLSSVAYAILGSFSEAEDVVSDCWLRLVHADASETIRDVNAWATVAVARAATDALSSARRRREVYVGPWLPEPIVELAPHPGSSHDPAEHIAFDESVRYALLVVLESLSPAERTAWVLHDLFGMQFEEVATIVRRSPNAVRQLASRARKHINARKQRVNVSREEHDTTLSRFMTAAAGGDLSVLIKALDPNVVWTSDGGGLVSAATRPVVGHTNVSRLVWGVLNRLSASEEIQPIILNGELGVGVFDRGRLTTAVALTLDGTRISRIDLIRTPRKLRLRDQKHG